MRIELKPRASRPQDPTLRRSLALALVIVGACTVARTAHAQSTSLQRPMPDVLLLVDTSGSMERMTDNSLPSANSGVAVGGLPNACDPGNESNPNRWGMLVQALTGNMQPYFSCAAMSRSAGVTGAAFRNEYKIGGVNPYDTDYELPYHRPLTGSLANLTTCAIGPHRLPGAADTTNGVGPGKLGYTTAAGLGGDVTDFPSDAIHSGKWEYLKTSYTSNTAPGSPLATTNACVFDQAPDGQLDAARDYVRFALMTFDNDQKNDVGVSNWPPSGNVLAPVGGTTIPFQGQWSYRRDVSNTDYSAAFSNLGSSEGLPVGCADPKQPFEVGARHWGAPPWEGRMVPFPAPDASMFDIQRTNEQIQKVLLTSRPYGATPIDGMLDDARDYFWYNSTGPKADPYVAIAGCREKFIILLTDGAPNLDMRPSCVGGTCPYPNTASSIAGTLYNDTTRRVTTFVIGFSVNGTTATGGDGFPTGYTAPPFNNCKAWYAGVAAPAQPTPLAMANACLAAAPPAGSTAEACCTLNKIAFEGSGGGSNPDAIGPFFAESQADIVLSFGKILASVTKAVSTRTVPTFTPGVYSASGFGAGAVTAQYLGSFIPNAQKPWSGEISRERSVCSSASGTLKAEPVAISATAGDSEAINLATQGAANRLFFTFVPTKYTVSPAVGTPPSTEVIDAAATVRPYYPNTAGDPVPPVDGIPVTTGTERGKPDWDLKGTSDFRLALDIEKTTCKGGRAVDTTAGSTGTTQVPALNKDSGEACMNVIMGFATAHAGAIDEIGTLPGNVTSPAFNFNLRCRGGTSVASGTCSISGATCNTSDADPCPAIKGQVCVPQCSPLGAIFRANLAISGPPDGVLRDAGYRAFQGRRSKRRPTLYAATTDGILHAFKAIEQATSAHHELWSFIPPAVLPRLASNYPAGNQILLDGSPVVKDTVWDRAPGDLDSGGGTTPGAKWHTTLVGGLGAEGGGYYALNVTDPDCNANPTATTGECTTVGTNAPFGASGYAAPADLDEAGRSAYPPDTGTAKPGPHFLWQLTDVPHGLGTDPAKVARRTKDGKERMALFGRRSGTPALTTVQINVGGADRQIGVAILPGGIDGPPISGQSCDRLSTVAADLATDAAFAPRDKVRRWAKNCTGADSAVPGRGVTIVRLDNGQILRHFGRQDDVPAIIWDASVVTAAKFDSPVIGTPVVYPPTIGANAQKIFVGDADGTLWRIDVTSNDPANWTVKLFADLIAVPGATWAQSQPIEIAPSIALEPGGGLLINAATGDQENVIYKASEKNYVWAIQETRPTGASASNPARALVKWYETLNDGERVTGPMTVFDRTLFFASFAPRNPASSSGTCDNAGVARLWGLNYFVADSTGIAGGGQPMWCPTVGTNGVCNTGATITKNEAVTGALAGYLIPGVTLRATQACSLVNSSTGEGTGNTGFETLSPAEFHLTYGVGKAQAPSASLPPSATMGSVKRPLPRIATTVNAWALVVD
jgi:type IV pilus assembly protein PilY1